jgi:site-specific DNA recombinase
LSAWASDCLVAQRLERLTDALLDGAIDKPTFDERKATLLAQRTILNDRREGDDSTFWRSIAERFELGLTALQGYEPGNDDEKREILKLVSSNSWP